jgi:undecaprenyl-diphosphatase
MTETNHPAVEDDRASSGWVDSPDAHVRHVIHHPAGLGTVRAMAVSSGARPTAAFNPVPGTLDRTLTAVRHARLSRSGARPRTRVAPGVLVAALAGFAALTALVRRQQVDAIDREIMARLQAIRHPWIERAMAFVSWFGFPPQSRVLPPTYAAFLWIARFRLEAVFQLAAWGTALLSTVVKAFMQRPRPVAGKDIRVVVAPLGGTSFPSGHVLTYVGVYGWMAIMADQLVRPPWLRRLVVATLTTLIAAVGPSRVHLGHHWPTDVAASYLLGTGYLAALLVAYRRLRSRGVLG